MDSENKRGTKGGTKKGTFLSPVFYKSSENNLFMETKCAEDIGEEIISRLNELIKILELRKNKDEKKFIHPDKDRNRDSE